jgi:hypothetical protein
MTNKQELKAKALELAIRQMALYPPILDNLYNNALNTDAGAFVKGNCFLSEITRLAVEYEELLKQA